MDKILTLIEDVNNVLKHKTPPIMSSVTVEERAALGARIATHFTGSLTPREGDRTGKRVWFSQLGTSCLRKEWYTYKMPEVAEPILPGMRFKFLYGNVIEELALQLVKSAAHVVEREQERIEIPLEDGWALTGRIDAVIDGHVIDVKSMSTYSYNAQAPLLGMSDDLFGYRFQLSGYHAAIGDPSKSPALLCVDKTLGHMKLSVEAMPFNMEHIKMRGNMIAKTADLRDPPPRRALVPYGKGGNLALDTYCSYCAYKKECWPGLRGFMYSKKVVWLAKVEEEPKVPEILYAPEE